MPEPLDLNAARRDRLKLHPRTLVALAAKRYAAAHIALFWAGAGDPADRRDLERERDAAELALADLIATHIPE